MDLAIRRRADETGDPVETALTVDGFEDGVQQRRHVHHLAVGAADELRRVDVAGARLEAEELRVGHKGRDVSARRRPDRQLLRVRCGSRRAVDGGHVTGSASRHGWSMVDAWSEMAVALPSMLWSMIAVWSATAMDSAPGESMLADTAASIGAAALAFAATAPSMGAARLRLPFRLTLTSSRLPSMVDPSMVVPSAPVDTPPVS